MKVVLLAGGFGTRISEESQFKPKPMIEIGGKPILWHILKEYDYYGFNDFILCAGYKQYVIKEWFADYFLHNSDITFDFTKGSNDMIIHEQHCEPWKVTVVDTGLNTMTGGRIKRVQKYVGNEPFLMTYGDGVCDVDISKLVEYKKLLEEQKLYGDIITDDEEEADEVNEDSVESNRDSAIDKYFQKMLAAENNYVSDDADDNSTADKDEDKTIASALNIPYRYTKGFYSLHTGIYTNKGNEAALYYRFVTRVEKDIVLEVYGASYNTDTKVYANDEYIGTITAYNETEGAVKYHKNEYGDREREDKVNDNLNTLKIPADIVGNDGIVKISFVPEETVNIYDYTSAISNDNFKKYKGFRITSVNMFY